MTLDQLRYFMTLAQWEHVGRAARAAAVSASALSTAVSQLEDELGYPLFDRIGRGIRLNSRGRALLPKAGAILAEVRSLREPGQAPAAFDGMLRLGASPFLAAEALSPAWGRFHRENPSSTFVLDAPATGEAIARVLRGDLDAALVFSPQSHPELRIEPILEGRLVAAARSDHPVFRIRSRSFGKLAELPFIAHLGAPGVELCESHEELRKHGIATRSSATFSSDEQAVRLLEGSSAWALLPDVVVRAYARRLRALPLPRDWNARYRICWIFRTGRAPSEGLSRFIELASAEARRLAQSAD